MSYPAFSSPTRRGLARFASTLLVVVAALGVSATQSADAFASPAPVTLGTAANFGVLGASAVTNTGPTVITGDLGIYPGDGTSVTGYPPGTVTGSVHAGDSTAQTAQTDAFTAYNDAAGRLPNANLSGQDLGGLTLSPGVYKYNTSAQLTGTLTLDGKGDPNAVFIFQIGSTLTTAPSSNVVLTNGASACGIFWQIGSSATLDTNTSFAGTLLALTSITANAGAAVNGRLLALDGAVTTDTATATATCAAAASPSVTVTKTANPTSRPEPGGSFNFSVGVTNTSAVQVTLTSLTDDVYGDLNGQGSCLTGGTIAAGATYNCGFAGSFTGVAGDSQTDVVTATVTDGNNFASNSDDATVSITASGVLEICKRADNANGTVSGTYTFTFQGRSVNVPVGTCTGPLTVAAGDVTVREVPKKGVRISACSTRPTNRLVRCDPANSDAVARVAAGGVANETILTFTNRIVNPTPMGAIKVCKIAGRGVAVGTNFGFTVGTKSVQVPAGPANQGGYCKILYGFTAGSNVKVTEALRSGTHVSAISVQPVDRKVSSSNVNRTATVTVRSGTTVVSFTNAT